MLTNDLIKILNRLQQAQNFTLSKLKDSAKSNFTNNNAEPTEIILDFGNENEEINNATQKQVEKNEDLNKVTKRQVELFELEDDIKDLNNIFSDLAVIIHSQGNTIKTKQNKVLLPILCLIDKLIFSWSPKIKLSIGSIKKIFVNI